MFKVLQIDLIDLNIIGNQAKILDGPTTVMRSDFANATVREGA